MVRKALLFFLISLSVLSVIPYASANLVVIPGKDDAFVVHWWAGENGELGADFYHFINGTLQPFYRTCLFCDNASAVNDGAYIIPDNGSWIFLREFYVPENSTRGVEAYRVRDGKCWLIGGTSVVVPPGGLSRVVVYYRKKAFSIEFQNGSRVEAKKFLIGESVEPANFSGFPEKTPVYYAIEHGVPMGSFYVYGNGYASNGSAVVLVPINVVDKVVSSLRVEGDIKGFASAIVEDGVILYYPYDYHVNGSPVERKDLRLFYYSNNGEGLKVFQLQEFWEGSGFASDVVCGEASNENGVKNESSGICGPAIFLLLALIPLYRAFSRKYS
ncbi:hypothetical protein APY94_11085 [Thermococcus celericrescens]|uniref:CGP-CTERM sorting domain-containing protein n=1 Tax=Thermococcus celericrescens TaxID=227598 RepID=A0A100XW28_9EURY|nr:CGP-CTERM sorting domain-containing protein [Thermococcus celericrescens]KUH32051.1 hypothetical protein APY94_11085 [Thermococcus celericrescens]